MWHAYRQLTNGASVALVRRAAPRVRRRYTLSPKMRAPSASRAQVDAVLQALAPSRTRMLASRRMLTRSMARAQLAGRTDGEKLLPAVDSSVSAAVAALRQAQARAGKC